MTKCGGLTEACRIAWMAHDHNVLWVPHGWNTAIGLAADLQLSGAMPVAKYVEFLSPSPYIDELVLNPFKPDADGLLTIPDKPGLGIELNRDTLKQYRVTG
jgi:L-alanine-DL-glutamate epimerase-like enolase superfamily enzyme